MKKLSNAQFKAFLISLLNIIKNAKSKKEIEKYINELIKVL